MENGKNMGMTWGILWDNMDLYKYFGNIFWGFPARKMGGFPPDDFDEKLHLKGMITGGRPIFLEPPYRNHMEIKEKFVYEDHMD